MKNTRLNEKLLGGGNHEKTQRERKQFRCFRFSIGIVGAGIVARNQRISFVGGGTKRLCRMASEQG